MLCEVAPITASGAIGKAVRDGVLSRLLFQNLLKTLFPRESVDDQSQRRLVLRSVGLWPIDSQQVLLQTDHGSSLCWIFKSTERDLAQGAARFHMVAVPILSNVSTGFTGHSAKASFLIPIAREFQSSLPLAHTGTAGRIDFEWTSPNVQGQRAGTVSICRCGRKELSFRGRVFGASSYECGDAPLLLRSQQWLKGCCYQAAVLFSCSGWDHCRRGRCWGWPRLPRGDEGGRGSAYSFGLKPMKARLKVMNPPEGPRLAGLYQPCAIGAPPIPTGE